MVWTDERWPDLTFKARADCKGGPTVYDLKRCKDAGEWAFRRKVQSEYLHTAAWHYIEGFALTDYGWIAADEIARGVAVYYPDADMLRAGQDDWERLVDDYNKCYRAGDFPGYAGGTISLPWGRRDAGGGDPWEDWGE